MTSLTLDEFGQLVPPFEATFQAHMAQWRFDGKPRTARRYTTDQNCPLPTPEERLLFILTYLKTYPLQVVHGRLFGMGQRKAKQWIHLMLVVLKATLQALGDAPCRSLQALAQRIGVTEAEAATLVVPPGAFFFQGPHATRCIRIAFRVVVNNEGLVDLQDVKCKRWACQAHAAWSPMG